MAGPFLQYFRDGAAAHDHIPVVKHHGLPRGHGPLGRVEDHLGGSVLHGIYGGGLLGMAVAGLGGDPQGLCQGGEGQPVPTPGEQSRGVQRLVGAHGNSIFLHIFGAYIDRLAQRDTQTLALSQRIGKGTGVLTDHIALQIEESAAGELAYLNGKSFRVDKVDFAEEYFPDTKI